MTTGEELAAQLRAAGAELAGYVRRLTAEQWRTQAVNSPDIVLGEDEDRLVGVVVHHVATSFPSILSRVLARVETGEAPPGGREEFDRTNAAHALEHPDPDQAETLALLAQRVAEAAIAVSPLTDEELVRGPEGGMNAGDFIRRVLIGHITWHLGSIQATFPGR